MAFNKQQINPLDLKPRVAIGVSIPFSSPSVFTSTYINRDAIKTNLINFFLTNKGERYLNYDFGGSLREFIFEQITNENLDFIKEDIQNKVNTYFPSIIINDLKILSQADNNAIFISITYSISNTNITDNIEITFE